MTSVGVIGLGEAGNLGDDLILLAVAEAGAEAGVQRLEHLTFNQTLPWNDLLARLGTNLERISHATKRDLPLSRGHERTFENCSAVIFGGGGLLQSVHHPLRPFHWLSYLPHEATHIPTLAVGVGVSPLSSYWRDWFSTHPAPFSDCYVRDAESLATVQGEFGWQAQVAGDFVTADFLQRLVGKVSFTKDPTLGVAIRRWPGLGVEALASHIDSVAEERGATRVRFFVLESDSGHGVDVDFSEEVARRTRSTSDVSAYRAASMVPFLEDMMTCEAAISMKLHSSVIWDASGSALYPIHYAPKTAALFGDNYHGLEIIARPRTLGLDVGHGISATSVLSTWVARVEERDVRPPSRFIQRTERVRLQTASLRADVKIKLGSAYFG